MESKDFNINDDGDLIIENGDFQIALSEEIHVEHILRSAKGDWKQYPLLGVHLDEKAKMPTSQTRIVELKKEIKIQLEYDNYSVKKVDLTNFENVIIACERAN